LIESEALQYFIIELLYSLRAKPLSWLFLKLNRMLMIIIL